MSDRGSPYELRDELRQMLTESVMPVLGAGGELRVRGRVVSVVKSGSGQEARAFELDVHIPDMGGELQLRVRFV